MENTRKSEQVTCVICQRVTGTPQGVRRHVTVKHAGLSQEERAYGLLHTYPAEVRVTHNPMELTAVQALAQTRLWVESLRGRQRNLELRKNLLTAGQWDRPRMPGALNTQWVTTPEERASQRAAKEES